MAVRGPRLEKDDDRFDSTLLSDVDDRLVALLA